MVADVNVRKISSEFPSAASFGVDVLLKGIAVHDFHVGTIPIEFLPRACGDIAEKQSFGYQSREFKISARLYLASLTSVDPFALIPERSRQGLWRLLVAVHFRFGNELGV